MPLFRFWPEGGEGDEHGGSDVVDRPCLAVEVDGGEWVEGNDGEGVGGLEEDSGGCPL